jgi:magnesium-transporting ATPase (P-type)
MDTLAAIAFGGEPTLEQYMEEKPRRRDESILSPSMQSAIITGALWTLAVSLFLLLSPYAVQMFRSTADNSYHMTGYFTFFIFAAIFNAFNARSEGRNLLDHLKENHGFLKIMGLIFVVQIILTQMGGTVFRCHGLVAQEWLFVLLLAVLMIPVDLLRKSIMTKQKKFILEKAV